MFMQNVIYWLAALKQELVPDVLPDRSEVKGFDAKTLKHVETVEKNPVPSKDGKSWKGYVSVNVTVTPISSFQVSMLFCKEAMSLYDIEWL